MRTLMLYRCCRLLRTLAVCRQLLDVLLERSLESSLAKVGQVKCHTSWRFTAFRSSGVHHVPVRSSDESSKDWRRLATWCYGDLDQDQLLAFGMSIWNCSFEFNMPLICPFHSFCSLELCSHRCGADGLGHDTADWLHSHNFLGQLMQTPAR